MSTPAQDPGRSTPLTQVPACSRPLAELIDAVLDEEATPAEAAALQAHLAADAEARARFVQACRLHAALHCRSALLPQHSTTTIARVWSSARPLPALLAASLAAAILLLTWSNGMNAPNKTLASQVTHDANRRTITIQRGRHDGPQLRIAFEGLNGNRDHQLGL